MGEIIADYHQHFEGERELVDWSRDDGVRYRDVPVMYLREVTREDYLAQFPHMVGLLDGKACWFFWEVSVD